MAAVATPETVTPGAVEHHDDEEKKPAKTTMFSDEAEICEVEAAVDESLPVLYGYLYKKSPGRLRLKAWDWRFFAVVNMKIIWWKNQESCTPEAKSRGRADTTDVKKVSEEADSDTSLKGMIDLSLAAAEVEEDKANPQVFRLAPRDGEWATGSTTEKRDEKRIYEFDCTDSAHPREKWVEVIQEHIEEAQLKNRARSAAGSEYWEDESIDPQQALAAARLVQKLEARKR
mmetsp:Transcript_18075/g.38626  ORF Transcript_18075/g.38626 Transcript_18075/m.38626 type:complete len:230 (-) Transcript_18075:51-740(-)|eukprot:CAMPEP_0206447496 /NCGR_PEP_ID=MMETSP0324_2-20121206/16844_1 /ASSEMBLY_ACC=CAM_ASM_000836 /TAXON_ID=2866 /ORGANISM="Crypthecodinium cohnii, Strain Seligo" /LENGTH=229 /DNA_ID=CAMNT_0053916325 /DNA_START=179 /DNA_END=868 /DNA_ORIENTATION=+